MLELVPFALHLVRKVRLLLRLQLRPQRLPTSLMSQLLLALAVTFPVGGAAAMPVEEDSLLEYLVSYIAPGYN